MCVLSQIICTTVVVALSILLAGGSLVCLSRGSWTQNDQIQGRNSADDLVTQVEPENQPLFDAGPSPGSPNRGTSSCGDHSSETSVWPPRTLVWRLNCRTGLSLDLWRRF